MDLFFFCPIPDDQKPISEYIELKENSINNWVLSSKEKYTKSLQLFFLLFFSILFFLFFPFFQFINFNQDQILQKLFLSLFDIFFYSLLSLNFFLFVIFFRWFELNRRLKKSRLFYEEGSWYDGKTWNKPLSLIKNEKLFSSQKIEPILQRLITTISSLLFINIFTFLILKFGI